VFVPRSTSRVWPYVEKCLDSDRVGCRLSPGLALRLYQVFDTMLTMASYVSSGREVARPELRLSGGTQCRARAWRGPSSAPFLFFSPSKGSLQTSRLHSTGNVNSIQTHARGDYTERNWNCRLSSLWTEGRACSKSSLVSSLTCC